MAAVNMLEHSVHLNAQPGWIKPELHLKQGTNSMRIRLLVPTPRLVTIAANGIPSDYIYKPCVIKGTRPDGGEIFSISSLTVENRRMCARIYEQAVQNMAAIEGSYKCTLTVVNTGNTVDRNNYMNYDILTVLPFIVVVEPRAADNTNQ